MSTVPPFWVTGPNRGTKKGQLLEQVVKLGLGFQPLEQVVELETKLWKKLVFYAIAIISLRVFSHVCVSYLHVWHVV